MGGDDDCDNLVKLTPREHFICHLLLPKMCASGQHKFKMIFAANLMRNGKHKGRERYENARSYEIIRKMISEAMRTRVVTDETRRKISLAHKGKKLPNEHKDKIKQTLLDRDPLVIQETYERVANSNRGKKRSAESRRNISEGQKGKKLSEDHKRKISEFQLNQENWADWNIGLKRTEDSKKKMREAWANRKDKSSAVKGKKAMWIMDGGIIKSKMIPKENIDEYLNDGWTLGMRPDRKKNTNKRS